MTDPTPQTPTRDEAVQNAADRMREFMEGARIGFATVPVSHIAEWRQLLSRLASAPAPASGGVDAVARRAKYLLNRLETDDGLGIGEIDTMLRMAASLSPAATPVSEAETVAWQTVSDFVDEMLRDWSGGDDCRMGFGVNGATVTKGQFRAVRSALASLSPAATPVSEAGGEAAERSWRRTKFEFIGAMRQALINSGLTREQVIIADNAITEAFSDLAKPASSPAPVRPIGNQGISDYQREIARNMAEGFAAWNAARQEALPSDEPASSPAGGDVVQTLIDKTEKLIEAADDMGWSCNSSSADQAIREARDAVRAALSQSTSAGRVGE